jgi:hypothetical protein
MQEAPGSVPVRRQAQVQIALGSDGLSVSNRSCSFKIVMVEPPAMPLLVILMWISYAAGLMGVILLIGSMLKQGVSLLGLVLLTAGFLLRLAVDVMVYYAV